MWLPALSAVTGLLAAGVLFVPGWALGEVLNTNNASLPRWLGGLAAAFGASVVAIYFQAALVIGAFDRADGGTPTVRSVLSRTWAIRGRVISWAVLTTATGQAIRELDDRLELVGKIIGFLAGAVWSIASFLVVPVLVAEGLGPIASVRRSAELIRATWGLGLRSTVRLGFTEFLLSLPGVIALALGCGLAANDSGYGIAVGVPIAVAGLCWLLFLAMIFSAVFAYARALIYRYAAGLAVSGVVDQDMILGAFADKKSRRWW